MFCLAINLAIMHTETAALKCSIFRPFLDLSHKIYFEKGYFKFLSYFNVMFGMWLYCIVFINIENYYISSKMGVYVFPFK